MAVLQKINRLARLVFAGGPGMYNLTIIINQVCGRVVFGSEKGVTLKSFTGIQDQPDRLTGIPGIKGLGSRLRTRSRRIFNHHRLGSRGWCG